MFVESEQSLGIGFRPALSGLARMNGSSLLERASADAYRAAASAVSGLCSRSPVPDVPVLTGFRCHDVVIGEGSALVAFRWEAAVRGHGRYPVLDADIMLTPAGTDAAVARLTGVYRFPSAAPERPDDRGAAYASVTATARALLSRVARAITGPGNPAP